MWNAAFVRRLLKANERLFLGFLKEDLFYFLLKIIFSEIFAFAIFLLCTLFDWLRYTIRLGPVHYSTESGTLKLTPPYELV